MSEKGNKNPRPKEYKAAAIFERSSVVSSLILRELFVDVTRVWKLKYLAEKVDCSIGQVSKGNEFSTRECMGRKNKGRIYA